MKRTDKYGKTCESWGVMLSGSDIDGRVVWADGNDNYYLLVNGGFLPIVMIDSDVIDGDPVCLEFEWDRDAILEG